MSWEGVNPLNIAKWGLDQKVVHITWIIKIYINDFHFFLKGLTFLKVKMP